MNLFYRKFGEGEPLFILHGLFGSSDNWMSIGKILATKHTVVLVDLRNHGRSPHSNIWNYDAMSKDIQHLATDLGFDHINLMGHSMGGKVAMTIACNYPAFLNKLIVIDISPKYYPSRHQKIINGLLSINLKGIASRKEADDKLSSFVYEVGVRQFLLKNLERDSEIGFKWKINLEAINNHLKNIGEATIPTNQIATDSLFIRGLNSNYITDNDIEEITKKFPNSRVESIAMAGHWVHAERPESFLKVVNKFLDE